MDLFEKITNKNFDIYFTFHSDAILSKDFPNAANELDEIFSRINIPIEELVGGGGGEANVTQRIRRDLDANDWKKRRFEVEKKISGEVTFATSHEVDHVKDFGDKSIAAEIEWNNKDPFYDRDLENFYRLHQDGAISLGIILTRGRSFQNEIENRFKAYAIRNQIDSFEKLSSFNIGRTQRQTNKINKLVEKEDYDFVTAWAKSFKSDKFGTATTHWEKLVDRINRGVGSPCPIIAIGIPIDCVTD